MFWEVMYKFIISFYGMIQKFFKIVIDTIAVALITVSILGGIGWGIIHNLYDQSKEEEYKILSNINEGTFRRLHNTEIYDKDGTKIGEIKAADFQYTQIKDISSLIQEGYIAVEDTRF